MSFNNEKLSFSYEFCVFIFILLFGFKFQSLQTMFKQSNLNLKQYAATSQRIPLQLVR